MEPELKQQAPKLIVGDAQVVDQNSHATDQAFSDNEKDNLPDLIPQEQESAKQIEKLSPAENTDKAKTDSPSDAKAGSPEQTKLAPRPGKSHLLGRGSALRHQRGRYHCHCLRGGLGCPGQPFANP